MQLRRPLIQFWCLAILLALLLCLFEPPRYREGEDLLLRFAVGQWLRHNGRLSGSEPFSWSSGGGTWIPEAWLADVLLYSSAVLQRGSAVEKIFRGDLLLRAILLVIGMFGAAFVLGQQSSKKNGLSVFLALVVYAFVGQACWRDGISIWAFSLLPLLFYLLMSERHLSTALVFSLSLLWVNVEQSALTAVVVPLSLYCGALLDCRRRETQMLGCKLALVLGTCFFSPLGSGVFESWFFGAASPVVLLRRLTCWQTPDFHLYPEIAFGIVSLILCRFRPHSSWDRSRLLCAVAGVVMILLSLRFLPLLAFVTAMAAVSASEQFSLSRFPWPFTFDFRQGALTFFPLTLVLLAGVSLWPEREFDEEPAALQTVLGEFAQYCLRQHKEFRLFSDIQVGGAVIATGLKTFVDRRPLLHGRNGSAGTESALEEYDAINRGLPGWEEKFRKRGFQAAFLRRNSALATVLGDRLGWKEIGQAVLGTRRVLGHEVLLDMILLISPKEEEITRIPLCGGTAGERRETGNGR